MKPTCLLISYVWPEPQSSAAGLRDVHLLNGLSQLGFEVSIASAAGNEFGKEFCEKRYSTHSILLNDDSFDAWLAQFRPDLVIFDRFVIEEQFGWRVRSASPQSLCILDTQDLHFLRISREKRLRQELQLGAWSRIDSSTSLDCWDRDLLCRELSSLHRVDLAWVLSPAERDLLVHHFGVQSERVALSRFAYPQRVAATQKSDEELFSEFQSRAGFTMVGNFRHAPNLDGFRWFRQRIWPGVRKAIEDAQVHLYGAYPPREVMEAHAPSDGFWVHGPASQLSSVFSNRRVSVAPLRFGAGIKGKISDSWWHGVPVVSTPIGAEGMGEAEDWGGLIGRDTQEIIDACIQLHKDFNLWKRAKLAGERFLDRDFSEVRFLLDLKASLEAARLSYSQRDRDWIRQMLSHSTNHAYRYFGKWIQEKNQKVLS